MGAKFPDPIKLLFLHAAFRLSSRWVFRGSRRFDITLAVLLLEPLDSSGGIDKLLLARIERVAHRTDFRVDFLGGTARLESVAATTMNHDLFILRMYVFFHNVMLQNTQTLYANKIGRYYKSFFAIESSSGYIFLSFTEYGTSSGGSFKAAGFGDGKPRTSYPQATLEAVTLPDYQIKHVKVIILDNEDGKMGIKLSVIGAGGRMGRRIVSLAIESGRFNLVAAIERPDHPDIGKDSGLVAASEPTHVILTDTFPAVETDVAIDFSLAEAVDRTIDYCLENNIALVSGTTALSDQQRERMRSASEKIPILHATNMSVGMNLLFSLAGKVAAMLGDEYDIEIIEQHHRFKKDAPSGSAMTLAENICRQTGRSFPKSLIYGRSGTEALREKGSIAVHAVRAGDITGVHSIIFGTLGETLTLNHTANSRDTFVHGALRAAEWLVEKKTGLFSMTDVLDL